jgi:hypothetical protein
MRQSFYFTGEATPNIHLHDTEFIGLRAPLSITSLWTFALAVLKEETLTQTNLLEKNRNSYFEADGVVA